MSMNTPKRNVEFIACSAIYYDSGLPNEHQPKNIDTGIVVCGLRHHNCFATLARIYPDREYLKNYEDGFVTSRNRFVGRVTALRIAREAGQIVKKHGDPNILYSEDIFCNEEFFAPDEFTDANSAASDVRNC